MVLEINRNAFRNLQIVPHPSPSGSPSFTLSQPLLYDIISDMGQVVS